MRVRSFWLCLTLTISTVTFANQESDTTVNLEQLIREVDNFLHEHYQQRGKAELDISVNRLDPRLRLSACELPIEYTLRDTGSVGGNVSVHTQCPGSKPWSLYVSASVKVMESVVVASRNIPKGTLLSYEDFDTQLKDTANLSNNYVADIAQLLGKSSARTIRAGEVLRFSLVNEPIAIKRGDTVVVEARTGAIVVSSQAVALADGKVGDQISVRNSQSERVVRIEILGPGRGRVIL